jgi:hypothetical protein
MVGSWNRHCSIRMLAQSCMLPDSGYVMAIECRVFTVLRNYVYLVRYTVCTQLVVFCVDVV